MSFPTLLNSTLGYFTVKEYLRSIGSLDTLALQCLEEIHEYGKYNNESGRGSKGKEVLQGCKNPRPESLPSIPFVSDNDFKPSVFKCTIHADHFAAAVVEPSTSSAC